jgi:Major Facilitator Superfamily
MEHPTRSPDTVVCNLAPAPVVLKRADVGRAGKSAPQAEATAGNAASLTKLTPSDARVAANNRWLSLGLIYICSLMIVLDATIVNVALPAIQQDLGFSQSALAWVANAYLLTFGGLMLISGRAADLFGRRRVLVRGSVRPRRGGTDCETDQRLARILTKRQITRLRHRGPVRGNACGCVRRSRGRGRAYRVDTAHQDQTQTNQTQ